MIVVDTSAWVELLRATGSATDRTVSRLLAERRAIAVTEVVVMELLAGARGAREAQALRARLLAFPVLSLGGLSGFEAAAELYRSCRALGDTPGSLADCLIAAATIAAGASLLHADAGFDRLARHTALAVEEPDRA